MWHRDPLCQTLSFHAHLEVKYHPLAGIVAVIRDLTIFTSLPVAMLLDKFMAGN